MRKFIYLLFFIAYGISSNSFARPANNIEVSIDLPEKARLGEFFEVKVTFQKEGLVNFGEYILQLPQHIEVKEKESGEAIFNSDAKQLRFTWIRLPRQKTFSVTFLMKATKAGSFTFTGEFLYIFNNQRGSVIAKSTEISIQQAPVNDTTATTTSFAHRDKLFDVSPKTTIVALKIKPTENVKKLVVIENFNHNVGVSIIDNAQSKIQIKGKSVTFSWDSAQKNNELIITYKITKTKEKDVLTINGRVEYEKADGSSQNFKIIQNN